MDFNQAPLLVIWEATQACDLECTHCRSSTMPNLHPKELTTEEGYNLLSQVKEFGNPLMVFTGGDPLKRPDLYDLIRHSVSIGLRTNVTPSPTALLTEKAIDELQQCGISRMALGLDGPDAPIHDLFRGNTGTFERTIRALKHAREIGLDTQVQTTVTRHNMNHLAEIAQLVADVRSRMWSLFFLVPSTAEMVAEDLTAAEYEKVFAFLYEIGKIAPFEVKTAEALHYRRYVAIRLRAERDQNGAGRSLFRTPGVSDGRGFTYVNHTGEIYPSGFLPVSGGNVRTDSLVDVYRNSTLFRVLRDPVHREGKCGYCEYGNICGGSRARAYALAGDYLADDPRCCYQPERQEYVAEPMLAYSAAV